MPKLVKGLEMPAPREIVVGSFDVQASKVVEGFCDLMG